MNRVAPAGLVSAALLAAVTACGSESHKPTSDPIAQDVATLRNAVMAGRSDEAVAAVDAVLNTAESLPADREGWKGAALLRARLPRIMARFLGDYPRTRRRLAAVRIRTDAGGAVKAWLLGGYAAERRSLLQLSAAVSKGTYVWGAVLEWVGENNAAIAASNAHLRAIVRGLPPAERQAVESAMAPQR